MPMPRELSHFEQTVIRPMHTGMKMLWLKALRSGEYKQGKDYLKSPDGFCCLGVLCDVGGCHWKNVSDRYFIAIGSGRETDKALLMLPPSVEDESRIPVMIQRYLAEANDAGVPFTEIANWIEANL